MPSDTRRGLLTEQERQYLKGQAGDVSNPRKIRYHIRQRIENALNDLALIAQHLEERDYRQLFDIDNGTLSPNSQKSTSGTVAFLYRLAALNGVDAEPIFRNGIRQGHAKTHPHRVPDVNVFIRSETPESILNSLPEEFDFENQLPNVDEVELRTLVSNSQAYHPETTKTLTDEKGPIQHVRELVTAHVSNSEAITHTRSELSIPVGARPDIVVRDADDDLTLIEILHAVTHPQGIQETAKELSELAVEYGDTAQVRKLIITLPREYSPSDTSTEFQGHIFEIAEDNTVLNTFRFTDETELLDLL